MKKALLLGLTLFGASAIYAGEVQQDESYLQSQTIPTTEGSYLDFSKAYSYYTGTDGNKVADGTALGNMRNGSYVVVMLDNTVTNNGYTLSFQGGNKNDGGVLVVSLYAANPLSDEEATPIFSQDVTINAMGDWTSKLPYTVTIPTSVPQGEVYMKLLASRTNTVAFSGNFDEFELTAIESEVNYYSLTTAVTPAEGGVISGNSAEMYSEGSSVSLTAAANPGYKFVKWEVGTSDSTDNPLELTINADTEVTAIFEEISNSLNEDMTFNLTDYYATSGTITIDASGIGSTKNKAAVIYKFSVAESGKYKVIANWSSKYDTTITMNISTDPEDFSEETAVSVDMTATGSWSDFVEGVWNGFNLESATTYYLRMSLATTSGWAGNINSISLKKDGTTAINAINAQQEGETEYYNLQGIRVDAGSLVHGIYVKRQGNVTSKIVVR